MPRTAKQNKEIREKTQQLILNTSLRLFSQKGFHATTIAEIAKEAGISKGLAYNYYKSKQDIAAALFMNLDDLIDSFRFALADIEDYYEKLRFTILSMLEFVDQSEEFWRLYIAFILQPENADLSKGALEKFYTEMMSITIEIFEGLEVKNPKVEARLLSGLFDGIILHYYIDKKNYPLKEILSRIIDMYSVENIEKMRQN